MRVIVLSLILSFFYFIDFSGLSSLSAFHSKTLFYQWTTSTYAGNNQNDITVVILRDESFDGSWPVSAIVHAEILDKIREYNPKAVFVNFAFIDERDDETLKDELIPVIEKFKLNKNEPAALQNCQAPPLYLLSITPTNELPDGVLPDLSSTGVATVSAPMEQSDHRGLAYIFKPFKNIFFPNKNVPIPVAFAIYNDINPQKPINIKNSEGMELVWRMYSSPENNNGPYLCTKQCEGVILKIFQRLINAFPATVSEFLSKSTNFSCLPEKYIRQNCPPLPTIDAHYLLNGLPDSDLIEIEQKKIEDPLKAALKGKYVFYGGDLDAIDDYILPPTHNPIPGIYFNAMAMDNLLTYGNDYIRHNTSTFPSWLEYICLLILVLLTQVYITILQGVCNKKSGKVNKQLRKKISRTTLIFSFLVISTFYFFSAIFVIFCCVIIGFFYFNSPPLDFLGLIGLIAISSMPLLVRSMDKLCKHNRYFHFLLNDQY